MPAPGSLTAAEAAASGVELWTRERREQFVPDEIGVLLGCTKMAATVRYGTACQAAELPVVAAGVAVRAGRCGPGCSRPQSSVLSSTLDAPDRVQVHTRQAVGLAPQDESRTGPQLREWLRRRVIAANPEAAEARRQRAMADRRVVITPTDDGMSELWALLPSVQARQIQQTLTTTAQGLGAADARSMDQRRADTLVDLLLGRAEPANVNVQVIVSADTLTDAAASAGTRAGDQPGWVPGLGPVPPPARSTGLAVDVKAGRVWT